MSKEIRIIVALILLVLGIIVFLNNGVQYNFYVLLLSYAIITLSVFQVFSKKSLPFSLHKITNLFFFFFIGLAPVLQFKKDIFFMGENGKLTDFDFIYGNIIFLSILVIYNGLYNFFNVKKNTRSPKKKELKFYTETFSNRLIFTVSLLSVIALLWYFDFNFESIFSRKKFKLQSQYHNKSILSISNVVRGVPLLMFFFFKINGKKNIVLEVVLLLFIVFCNFPTGVARYKVAVTFLPLFLVYFKPLLKKEYFTFFFICNFLIVFPYLHHFRYNNKIFVNPLDMKMFTDLHFDSYQNSLNIIVNNIITYGEHLKGVLFFYIPNQFWPTKPSGSGSVLANNLNYDGFSNVAVSFFGEGFLNFGYIGILMFIVVLAKLNSYFDCRFWMQEKSESYFTIIYLLMIPFEFFILRGSLKAPFANFCGYVFFTVIAYILFRKFSLNKRV
nr:O-antigen polysaccharide polymerase Wzy [Olleya namhaensis]